MQLATGIKRRISELIKGCPLNLNGLETSADFNILPLGSYDVLIRTDSLEKHHDILNYLENTFTCVDDLGNPCLVKWILRKNSIRQIYALQLKRSDRKSCKLYATSIQSCDEETQ